MSVLGRSRGAGRDLLSAGGRVLSAGTEGRNVSKKQPNIVFFFWDNLGWGEVGCYGGGVLRARRRRGSTSSRPRA